MAKVTARRLLSLGIAVLVATAVAMLPRPVFAQNAGSLRGTVTDTTGAVVPGANVTLTNEATRSTRTGATLARMMRRASSKEGIP